MSRVWASRPGIEPKMVIVIGTKIHCRIINNFVRRFSLGPILGKKLIEIIAEKMSPHMASNMRLRVTSGRLYERSEALKTPPPSQSGNQPSAKIMIGFVASDQKPSSCTKITLIFFHTLMRLFLMRPKIRYGTFSTPQPQRRCCLYIFFTVSKKVGARLASIEMGYER